MTLAWQDGLPYSTRFGDVYFSADSGLDETRHVFLAGNGLHERFTALRSGETFTIGETGFGTGLNFLCAWQLFVQLAPPGASLDFFSVEKFPLADDELHTALTLWPELTMLADALCARWRRRVPGWNRWSFAGGRVRLTLATGDVAEVLPEASGKVDAWFLDGFSPARNPEMWAEPVMSDLARLSSSGATLATYTSAGWVRRGLQQAGFVVEKKVGFGRKREMLRGKLPGERTKQARPDTAIVIGTGLAGCAAARALAQRGIAVTLIDRAPELANGASGNPRGILHARFSAGMDVLHQLVLASYGHALALLDELLPEDGVLRAECGLLQLATPGKEAKRIEKLAAQDWPPHILQTVDAAQASSLAGLEMQHGGLWFPAGGWVSPPAYCARLVDHPLITQRFDLEARELVRTTAGWRVCGEGWQLEAEQVVVCCAHHARSLPQFAEFILQPVRGQITQLPATNGSGKLSAVLCADVYCTPPAAGVHVAGASTVFDDDTMELRESEHLQNIAKLAEHMPALSHALGTVDVSRLSGRASVRCSTPGAMPIVGEVAPGLYCSLAHGTRGLLTAGLAGEVIGSSMCGQFAPLPQSVLAALDPVRRLSRGKRDRHMRYNAASFQAG